MIDRIYFILKCIIHRHSRNRIKLFNITMQFLESGRMLYFYAQKKAVHILLSNITF